MQTTTSHKVPKTIGFVPDQETADCLDHLSQRTNIPKGTLAGMLVRYFCRLDIFETP